MNRYLLSIYQPTGAIPPPDILEKIMRDLDAVNREINDAGAWVLAGGLYPLENAKVARLQDGVVTVTDGPFAETKEFLGGISIISAPDLNTALGWARKIARATTLPIEVREFH